jgi:hypothetical protein
MYEKVTMKKLKGEMGNKTEKDDNEMVLMVCS